MKCVWNNASKVEHIRQFYLKSKKGFTHRVREVRGLGSNKTKYLYTIKKAVSPGVNEENEKDISKDRYWYLISERSAQDKLPIHKTRYTFDFENQVFELDIFENKLEGLAVLEIELDHIGTRVSLPPFLKVVREVTKLKSYKNSHMAKLSYASMGNDIGKMLGA